MHYWLALAGAIAFEVAGTISMKLSLGFTKLAPSVLMIVFYMCSFAALTLALKRIDVSVAYATWAGAGTALIAVLGIWYFQEPYSTRKAISRVMRVAGVVGVTLSGASH